MEPHEGHAEYDQNNYVDLVSESHGAIPQQTISHVVYTQSQKKRRRFIPFKYHSKIFKTSKKKRHVDDHRISTNSSSYASCRTFKKDSGKSNVSSHTYQDIEECIHHAELARCNSIASESTVSREAHKMTLETDEQGILKAHSTDSSVNRNTQIHYKMEFPKKTGIHAKKYMVIFCMILVCAIISAVIASVFSTKSLRENIPSDVKKQLSNGEFLKQTLSNVTNEVVKHRMDDLRNEVHNYANETKIITKSNIDSMRDMKDFSNKTKIIIGLLQTLPNKEDMEKVSNTTMMTILELLLQTLPNKADIEEVLNTTRRNTNLLQQTLSIKSDFDMWKEEVKRNSYRLIHAFRCKSECLKDGDYQSCNTCKGFITCTNGILVRKYCADANNDALYWDDYKKQCLIKSKTCDPAYAISEEDNN